MSEQKSKPTTAQMMADLEQMEGLMANVSSVVAVYYNELIANKVPATTARELSLGFQMIWLSHLFEKKQ